MEALFREEGGMATGILGSGPNASKVGAFGGPTKVAAITVRTGLHHVYA